ncbi:DUF4437 domain-containing protein [Ramlibacter henchirensis]|uniref:DUF4437 domain-containing protein n=1 Tax=Ramlibacter henchirensis TaxID=204072 RepID=A0A4Z0C241_9BURK|nr:cupin domain-containing protein [Ramlibacter henchirensis]TFZ05583.1 DUF4437 domain-containing protein [Ramlibacter henchirensis]
MKHLIPSPPIMLAAALCAVSAGAFAAAPAPDGEAKVMTPNQFKWGDAPPAIPKGAKIAVLHGDPGKEGPFIFRLKMPANFKVPPHTHPSSYTVTVISGTPSVGMGDKADAKKTHALKAGAFHYLPAKTSHYWIVKEGAELQVQGTGPFGLTYVNPEDDPQKMAARK